MSTRQRFIIAMLMVILVIVILGLIGPVVGSESVTVNVNQAVHFDGSKSYDPDPDGTIVFWSWDFDSDGIEDATGEKAIHTYSTAGTYTATLTVTDNEGATAADSVTVEVKAEGEEGGITAHAEPFKP